MIVKSRTTKETREFGKLLGETLKDAFFNQAILITLSGNLGSGKTTLIQGIGRGLGIKRQITSPTFLIMRSYPFSKERKLYHIDAYRIENKKDAAVIEGEKSIFKDPSNIIVIEWPERVRHLLLKEKIVIILSHGKKEFERTIVIRKNA